MVEPLRVPWAVPVSFRSLAQVALKEPRAEVAVCSVTFHLKSVHVLGVGIRLDDVQLPKREPVPPAEGPVGDFPRSYPRQAAAEPATARQRASCASFFMSVSIEYRAQAALRTIAGEAEIIAGSTRLRPIGSDRRRPQLSALPGIRVVVREGVPSTPECEFLPGNLPL